MSRLLILIAILSTCAMGTASEWTARRPAKAPRASQAVEVLPSPTQGGDTIGNAQVIPSLPFTTTGFTNGFADDYDEACPDASTAPDVVYQYQPAMSQLITIDLCGSQFDTKVYVLGPDLAIVACNDDYYGGDPCGIYVSRLDLVPLVGGDLYYIVIDGYGSESGVYDLAVTEASLCEIECPGVATVEGEPPLVDEYLDAHNGGCNGTPVAFQTIVAGEDGAEVFCGRSGWYLLQNVAYRDTDWLIVHRGSAGDVEATLEAEFATYLFELGPQDCDALNILRDIEVEACGSATMTLSGYDPESPIWLWVGPTTFSAPSPLASSYDYVLTLSGLSTPTEATTWSTVKALWE